MAGTWFAVELVHHRYDSKLPRGDSVVHTCPVVYLSLDHDGSDRRGEKTGIRLIWSEDVGTLNYYFNVDLDSRPGFWISSGAQNGNSSYGTNPYGQHGTLAMPTMNKQYRQFAGTVEVTKVVGSHMVLTFCMPGQQLFSVVLAREKSLPPNELRGVNSLLERKGLTRVSTRQACRNGADRWRLALESMLIVVFCIVFSKVHRT
ncbi:Hypothetical protein NTJ_08098 [Nesidiocoris tenuis]|uniref:DOMON domain-containing protein n=1 Tax=Nesidiocoris tenuis TaxID=355587 RepID=A0ABN7ASW2_9HEMI|nr:Hypothetical protein NTJ_08098 [Nesidiocoris tenuis]